MNQQALSALIWSVADLLRGDFTMSGQELNPQSYAICKAEMLIKGQDVRNIVLGDTLSDDGLPGKRFDYMLSNPPFGADWKKVEKGVRREAERRASPAASAPACRGCTSF